jgi:hypothetical protein
MLLRNGPMSRVDITRKLKCDGTTITHIIREWIRKISGKFLERTLRTSYNFLLCEPLPANPEAFNL